MTSSIKHIGIFFSSSSFSSSSLQPFWQLLPPGSAAAPTPLSLSYHVLRRATVSGRDQRVRMGRWSPQCLDDYSAVQQSMHKKDETYYYHYYYYYYSTA